jgi:hypothetical protein
MSGTSTLVARTPKADDILKADAALLAATSAAGNEHAKARAKAFADLANLGATWAEGAGSLTQAAFDFHTACAGKVLTLADAKEAYLAVARGYNSASSRAKRGLPEIATDDKALQSPVSTFGSFGKAGPISQGLGLYVDVIRLRATILDAKPQSAYNCMVKANREIEKATSKMGAVERAAFKVTDDMILAWITPDARAEKDALAKLADLVSKLGKLAESDELPALDLLVTPLLEYHARIVKAHVGKADATAGLIKGAAETKH